MPIRFAMARFAPLGAAKHDPNNDDSGQLSNASYVELTGSSATAQPWQTLNGLFRVSGGSTFTLTTPTAAQLKAYFPNAKVGSSFCVGVINDNSGTFTLAGGTGVTATSLTSATGVNTVWVGKFTNVSSGTEAVTITAAP